MRLTYLSVVMLCFCFTISWGQTNKKYRLENERKQLQKELQQIDQLLSDIKNNEESVVAKIEELNKKIDIHKELINIIANQEKIINRQIVDNRNIITQNKKELNKLKLDYASMIQNSYKANINNNRIMFLLSSKDFIQGYKRLLYMKQYADYRRKQGLVILDKTDQIKRLNTTLVKQLQNQKSLKLENEKVKGQLMKDKASQQELVDQIRSKESNYKKLVHKKQKEYKSLNEQIEKLIKEAIEVVNKKSSTGSKNNSVFKLAPEAKKVALSFVKNKGNLLWPVQKGIVIHKFGQYSDPIYPNIKYFNNGITISCPQGENARSVFDGVVTGIIQILGGSKAVQVRHGNYITTYYNLSDVFVRKDEEVNRKDFLGKIFVNPITGKTILKFFLYKDKNKLNPMRWLLRN